MFCAHSVNASHQRHDLVGHLRAVAKLASEFAAPFGAAQAGHYAGLWHDLGKFHPKFQEYLLACEANPKLKGTGPDHKGAGAVLAAKHLAPVTSLVQGHHGGLRSRNDLATWLAQRRKDPAVRQALDAARQALPDLEPSGKVPLPAPALAGELPFEIFLRLLFSALVDADFLDTEGHFNPGQSIQRSPAQVTMDDLWKRFEADQERLTGRGGTIVDQARHAIYQDCLAAAENPPGLFRLTVPTGGGKTRSAMAFALRHALRHGMRRIIVAVPFISITQQTAKVYEEIFGKDMYGRPIVLEHHSQALVADPGAGDFHPSNVWARLAAENWDAPIIVTTTVQLFESLFGNTTSDCRKLHRLARSVMILDEAQALPARLLTPILDSLQQLCAHYGSTVVLSTATQPAFEAIPVFAQAQATEIVPGASRWFGALKRVAYDWRVGAPLSWGEVAAMMTGQRQALAVVNTKEDAFAMMDALADSDALHLSTRLCGAHRREVIEQVGERLKKRQPCRLVSTQVIEAGVDLDFPLVLRALGPLDSVIQAAGRCNREGLLPGGGRVVVFLPEGGGMPSGPYCIATNITLSVLGSGALDPDSADAARKYFRLLFESVETDREQIQSLRKAFDYPEVAHRFRMIDDATESVVIDRYGSPDEQVMVQGIVKRLRESAPDGRLLLRRLQPYVVSLYAREAARYRQQGLIEPVQDGLGLWLGDYHPVRGLVAQGIDPDRLVA